MRVGFLGMSHLGQVYSTTTAICGASVVQFEVDIALLRELEQSGPTVMEPGLNEIWFESSTNRKLTADPELLRGCDLLFVVSDVLTDEEGKSDLHKVRQLTDLAVAYASSECPIVIRSQVPPGFTREYAQRGRQVIYQVETLVFSEAVTRAVNPDRHIIGVENRDLPLPGVFSDWLQMFPAPFHVMSYESAELAKISINMCLVASVSTANTLAELLTLARSQPGKLNFAIGGLGSSLHLAGDAFKMKGQVFIVNIPYRGTAPAIADVLAGQVELMFANIGNAQAHIKAGRLKALGVTSPSRLPLFPDVPAIAEALPGFESSAWFGLFGPARMDATLTQKISQAARLALLVPAVRRRIEAEGAQVVGNSAAEFERFVAQDVLRWRDVVRYAGAKPE